MKHTNFTQYILEMAKVKSHTNYDGMNLEPDWEEHKDKAKLLHDSNIEKLYKFTNSNENYVYILTDAEDNYIAGIEIDSSGSTRINNKNGLWIDAGHAKIRGGYAKLLSVILKNTNNHFIMSDILLSDRAAKFWSKYLEAIETLSYNKIMYHALTKEVVPYDKRKAFSYGYDDRENEYWHIGVMK